MYCTAGIDPKLIEHCHTPKTNKMKFKENESRDFANGTIGIYDDVDNETLGAFFSMFEIKRWKVQVTGKYILKTAHDSVEITQTPNAGIYVKLSTLVKSESHLPIFKPYELSAFRNGKVILLNDLDIDTAKKFVGASGLKFPKREPYSFYGRYFEVKKGETGEVVEGSQCVPCSSKIIKLSECFIEPEEKGKPEEPTKHTWQQQCGRGGRVEPEFKHTFSGVVTGEPAYELQQALQELNDKQKKTPLLLTWSGSGHFSDAVSKWIYNKFGNIKRGGTVKLDEIDKEILEAHEEQTKKFKDYFENNYKGNLDLDFSKMWDYTSTADEVVDNAVKAVDKEIKSLKKKAKKEQKSHDKAKGAYYITGHDMEYFDETDGTFKKCPSRRIYRFIKKD